MNIFIFDNDDIIYKNIFNELFIKGYKTFFFNIDNIKNNFENNEILNNLRSNSNNKENCLIIFNYKNNIEILNKIKDKLNCYKQNLIIITNNISKDEFENIIKFYPKKVFLINSIQSIINNLKNYILSFHYLPNEKRFCERYNTENFDLEATFKNPLTLKNSIGKLINISLTGIKIKFYKELEYFDKLVNKISDIKIFFTEDPFVSSVKLIYYNNKEAGFKFIETKKEEYNKLLNFLKFFIFYR